MIDVDSFLICARQIFGDGFIPLHRPIFEGNERRYLTDCIDSNFVSSVGEKVNVFEEQVAQFVGAKYAVATMNGTAALHLALELAGVKAGEEVISQALTFVATCNAISYIKAKAVFLDVDIDTMGLSPIALENFLNTYADQRDEGTFNKLSGNRLAACVPMHTFGIPCRINEIKDICTKWGIYLVEDAAESLGSYVGSAHTGTIGRIGTLSFNGNKVITTGGGGMIITNDSSIASQAKHLSTTAKTPHPYEFRHNEIGYNYRLPNLNAALGCAQMENLHKILEIKKEVSDRWRVFFSNQEAKFIEPLAGTQTNYWLNAVLLNSKSERDIFLRKTNEAGVMTRPAWELMHSLPMFKTCIKDSLKNSKWLHDRLVNVPSSVPNL